MADLQVFERPSKQRFWVVRASSGGYIQHFLHGGIAAIGHLDEFLPETLKGREKLELDIEKIEARLRGNPKISPARATSHLHQIARFIDEITDGDLVVSANSSSLLVGRIIGPAFVSQSPVIIKYDDGRESKLEFCLRRQVAWGPSLERSRLPYPVEASLYSHQTVFNIDDHWSTIYHLLYPFFQFKDDFYFSIDITRSGELSNFNIAKFFSLLSELETIARSDKHSLETRTVDELLRVLANQDRLRLSTKAGFMSLGSIWSKLPASRREKYVMAALLLLLFSGVDIDRIKLGSGLVEIEGIRIPAVVDGEAVIAAAKRYAELGYDALICRLGLQQPKHNTKPLEEPRQPKPNVPDRTTVLLVDSRREERD